MIHLFITIQVRGMTVGNLICNLVVCVLVCAMIGIVVMGPVGFSLNAVEQSKYHNVQCNITGHSISYAAPTKIAVYVSCLTQDRYNCTNVYAYFQNYIDALEYCRLNLYDTKEINAIVSNNSSCAFIGSGSSDWYYTGVFCCTFGSVIVFVFGVCCACGCCKQPDERIAVRKTNSKPPMTPLIIHTGLQPPTTPLIINTEVQPPPYYIKQSI